MARHAQAFGNGREFLGRFLGDLLTRFGRLKLLRIMKNVF
jgi:hypothetical protein